MGVLDHGDVVSKTQSEIMNGPVPTRCCREAGFLVMSVFSNRCLGRMAAPESQARALRNGPYGWLSVITTVWSSVALTLLSTPAVLVKTALYCGATCVYV